MLTLSILKLHSFRCSKSDYDSNSYCAYKPAVSRYIESAISAISAISCRSTCASRKSNSFTVSMNVYRYRTGMEV